MRNLFAFILIVFFLAGCSGSARQGEISGLQQDSYANIKSNLEFLASDELEGREATRRGERIAGEFIATRLQQYGVKPFGDNGTYFQSFNLELFQYSQDSKIYLRSDDGQTDTLAFGSGFVPRYELDSTAAVAKTDLVYMRYGIEAPELDYNDYKDVDVSGKTIVVLGDVPFYEQDTTAFNKYAGSRDRRDMAADKGVTSVVYILSPKWLRFFTRLGMRMSGESFNYPYDRESKPAVVYVDSTSVKKLFSKTDMTYDQVFEWLKGDPLPAGHDLGFDMDFDISFSAKLAEARNVIGIVEGNDPDVADQYVSVGAHYDHVGMREIPGSPPIVYNGADDNASGTTAIMEAARIMAATKSNKRPVVFMFFSAEEKGLLGARYLAENWEHTDNVIVNINMDMVGREHPDTMFVIGSGKLSSEFYDIVEEANKASVNFAFDYTLDDEGHPERIYYRSDHWQFAKRGIPVVFLTDYHDEDYHRPTDDADKIKYEKVVKTSYLTVEIAKRVANLGHKLKVDKPVVYEGGR